MAPVVASNVPWHGPVVVPGIVVWLMVKLPVPVRVMPPSTTTLPSVIVTLLPEPSLMPPGPQSIHQLPAALIVPPGVHEYVLVQRCHVPGRGATPAVGPRLPEERDPVSAA